MGGMEEWRSCHIPARHSLVPQPRQHSGWCSRPSQGTRRCVPSLRGSELHPPRSLHCLCLQAASLWNTTLLKGRDTGPQYLSAQQAMTVTEARKGRQMAGGSPLCLQGWAWHTNLCSPLFKTPTSSGSRPLFVEGRKGGCVDALEGASTHVDVCHVTLRGSLPRGRQYAHATHRGRCQHLQTPRDALPRVPTYWLVPAQPSVVA